MNYESGSIRDGAQAALPDYTGPENRDGDPNRRRRRWLLWGAAALALLVVLYLIFGRGGDFPAGGAARGGEQVPSVTVAAPGSW